MQPSMPAATTRQENMLSLSESGSTPHNVNSNVSLHAPIHQELNKSCALLTTDILHSNIDADRGSRGSF
jgi:hypothetical protein